MEKAIILKKLIEETGLSFRQFSIKAGVPYTTLLSILDRGVGKASVDNVLKICGALGISAEQLSNMAGEHYGERSLYYIEPGAAEIAQEMYERPEMRILFDASRKASKEDIEMVAKMLEKMYKSEKGED